MGWVRSNLLDMSKNRIELNWMIGSADLLARTPLNSNTY